MSKTAVVFECVHCSDTCDFCMEMRCMCFGCFTEMVDQYFGDNLKAKDVFLFSDYTLEEWDKLAKFKIL